MKTLPLSIGTIHFVGIGGIGMSGVAEVLHNLGYKVQGSDITDNANVKRLRRTGISTIIGHAEQNIKNAQVVVISSAVKADNPEVIGARKNSLPLVRRAEMLGELMRLKWSIAVAGTHGKTTTTSLIAAILDAADYDPTVINGGIINAIGSNARVGSGEWMVAEADESDGTFLKLPATIAVVTNINPEHLNHYGSFDKLRDSFQAFIENIPFYGFAALCIDHPEVKAMISRIPERRIITYGFSPQADVRGINMKTSIDAMSFDVVITDHHAGTKRIFKSLKFSMLGQHNVQNALAAILLANEMKIDDQIIRHSLAQFGGVGRRFTKTGEVDDIVIIDDYAHHPVEISAVLQAARSISHGKVIAILQPHRYSRLHSLFKEFCTCFNDADTVLVSDVHSAGEQPINGADRNGLVADLRKHGHRSVISLNAPEDLPKIICDLAQPGDLVVCLGAGSITQWAHSLPDALRQLRHESKP